MPDKGFIQVYTGNGKGKTTASLGVSLRILGCGLKVFFAQFIKDGKSAEFESLNKFGDAFVHKPYGGGRFLRGAASLEDIGAARKGLDECAEAVSSGEFGLVVFDEANSAVKAGLFSAEELLEALSRKHVCTEVIVTGRDATPELIEFADLVTEMKEIKHYWKKGVQARKGIEK